jgi:hypothetical protein
VPPRRNLLRLRCGASLGSKGGRLTLVERPPFSFRGDRHMNIAGFDSLTEVLVLPRWTQFTRCPEWMTIPITSCPEWMTIPTVIANRKYHRVDPSSPLSIVQCVDGKFSFVDEK